MYLFKRSLLTTCIMTILISTAYAEDVVNVGTVSVKGQALGNGLMIQEDTPKARSVVTAEAINRNPNNGSALDKVANVPGLQVTSTDHSGLSSIKYTMRGMNSDQIGLSVNGVPMNDSGNYNVYSAQLGDAENVSQVFVTQGSSEIDGPHIGSSGGNIGLTSKRPDHNAGIYVEQKVGSNSLSKTFARIETGDIGHFSGWLSASHTQADKWTGLGDLESDKVEANALYKAENGNTSNLSLSYAKQNNYFYQEVSKSDYDSSPNSTGTTGHKADYSSDSNSPNYYKYARNPFKTATLSFTQDFLLSDTIKATLQPYYYWGDGGGATSGKKLSASSSTSGIYDLSNLSGSRLYYRPSLTTTWRPGITAKVKWDINEKHSLSTGYWYERARQRQTQPYIYTTDGAVWGNSNQVLDTQGNIVQGRNQYTVTPAQRVWLQDTWYLSPAITFVGGLAWEHVKRTGTNYGSLTTTADEKTKTYSQLLPNFSAKYQLNDKNQFFYNVSKNMRTPPNYVLYYADDSLSTPPEISVNNELGWRYQTQDMLLSATLFNLHYKNHEIFSKNTSGNDIMINAGTVDSKGVELEWSGKLPHNFNYYTSYTYTDSEQKDNIVRNSTTLVTSGKQTPNTSKNTLTASLGYDNNKWMWNTKANYVSSFYGDMTNDEKIGGRTTFDLSAGVHLPIDKKFIKEANLNFGVNNLFNKEYLGFASTVQQNSKTVGQATGSTPYYIIGEERTFVISLSAKM